MVRSLSVVDELISQGLQAATRAHGSITLMGSPSMFVFKCMWSPKVGVDVFLGHTLLYIEMKGLLDHSGAH